MGRVLPFAVVVWLAICAMHDYRRREVPHGLTLPALGLALVWRAIYPDGWMPWAVAAATVLLALANALPGGDMIGLVSLALLDMRLYLAAWLGAGMVYLLWRLVRRERGMPGYVGFLVGVTGYQLATLAT